MDREDIITYLYCVIDDAVKKILQDLAPLRSRGRKPQLSDSEALTIEVVGEFFGLHSDKQIWSYARDHLKAMFPKIPNYSSFAKHCFNIISLKKRVFEILFSVFSDVQISDGVPLPVCHKVRGKRDRCFKGYASFGYCAAKKETYYGFKGHIMINPDLTVTHFTLTAANVDERDVVEEYAGLFKGHLLADKGLISEDLRKKLDKHGIDLQTPLRKNMKDDRPTELVQRLLKVRRRVETAIGQLCEQFFINKITAKTFWHFNAKLIRKVIAYNLKLNLSHR
jgi:Transposase DDE domain